MKPIQIANDISTELARMPIVLVSS